MWRRRSRAGYPKRQPSLRDSAWLPYEQSEYGPLALIKAPLLVFPLFPSLGSFAALFGSFRGRSVHLSYAGLPALCQAIAGWFSRLPASVIRADCTATELRIYSGPDPGFVSKPTVAAGFKTDRISLSSPRSGVLKTARNPPRNGRSWTRFRVPTVRWLRLRAVSCVARLAQSYRPLSCVILAH